MDEGNLFQNRKNSFDYFSFNHFSNHLNRYFGQYAANPGRFIISEVKQDVEHNTQSVSIRATYPFGNIDIEQIEVKQLNSIEAATEPKSKTSAPTKVIKTTTISEVAVIGNELSSLLVSLYLALLDFTV